MSFFVLISFFTLVNCNVPGVFSFFDTTIMCAGNLAPVPVDLRHFCTEDNTPVVDVITQSPLSLPKLSLLARPSQRTSCLTLWTLTCFMATLIQQTMCPQHDPQHLCQWDDCHWQCTSLWWSHHHLPHHCFQIRSEQQEAVCHSVSKSSPFGLKRPWTGLDHSQVGLDIWCPGLVGSCGGQSSVQHHCKTNYNLPRPV